MEYGVKCIMLAQYRDSPLVFRHSMTKESECPRRRFSGLAWGTAGRLNERISPGEGVVGGVCVGRRTYSPKVGRGPPPLFIFVLAWVLGGLVKDIVLLALKRGGKADVGRG